MSFSLIKGFFNKIKAFFARIFSSKQQKKVEEKTISEVKFQEENQEKVVIEKPTKKIIEVLPTRVDGFDLLLADNGLERGTTTLLAGGAGTGKTTFCMQSLYFGALHGEKGVYISFEEDPTKIKAHMKKNFGWDFDKLEKEGLFAVIKLDPAKIARQVEGLLASESGLLKIEVEKLKLPLQPDRIAIDSLSALSIAFKSEDSYRKYIKELFELLEEYNSVNYAIDETEQDPKIYSRTGVEEFLADAVVVLYNIREDGKRRNALEILKLRSGKHIKGMVPFRIADSGFEVMPDVQTIYAIEEAKKQKVKV